MTTTEQPRDDAIVSVRKLMPTRALKLYEHLGIAERQATALHRLLRQESPAANLNWLMGLSKVEVVLLPRWKMEGLSGMTTWSEDHWLVGVNKGNPHVRRRFTLCHELKHVIDASRDKITYEGLTDGQREYIADYFAACYLMPKNWVRRSWTGGIQDVEALAGLFNVSLPAMRKRLGYLGFIDDQPDRTVASYFRIDNSAQAAA